jgi:hypothetical protein
VGSEARLKYGNRSRVRITSAKIESIGTTYVVVDQFNAIREVRMDELLPPE